MKSIKYRVIYLGIKIRISAFANKKMDLSAFMGPLNKL